MSNYIKMVTQSELKEYFEYNEFSGDFIRKKLSKGSGSKIGDAIGTVNVLGYKVIRINKKLYYSHRLVWLYMYGLFPEAQIDHKNHNRADNRLDNLREVTQKENRINGTMRSDNKSGFTGVHWNKLNNKWIPRISIRGNNKHLGCFESLNDAVICRKMAEYEHGYYKNHGEG